MTRHDRRERALAVSLSLLAGYIDALGFLKLGGFFVSFMSGNSTRLGVGLATDFREAVLSAILVALFVLGVVLGSLVARMAGRFFPRRPAVLAFVTVLLAMAAAADAWNAGFIAIGAMALAMGAENASFERDGEVSIGLTYMTGTLVKLGQRLTDALLGGNRFAWVWYLMLWSGLVAGAALGTLAYNRLGLAALWPALPFATMLTGAGALIAMKSRSAAA